MAFKTRIILFGFVCMAFYLQSTAAYSMSVTRNILRVGPGGDFSMPSDAAKLAKDGDTIEIDAMGNYLNDTAVWRQNNILIRSVNGRAVLKSNVMIKNNKAIWIIKGNNVYINGFEFSGAKVSDKNGAAIRLEGKDLRLSDCYIHNNENGLLTGNNQADSTVIVEN